MLSPAWKDWEQKASHFPPEVAFQLYSFHWINLVARARDPLWEESWGSGKEPKRMHGIHCISLLSDPVH